MEKTLYEIMIEEMVARGMRKQDTTGQQQLGDLTWAVFNRERGDEGFVYSGTSMESKTGNELSYEGVWNFEEDDQLEFGRNIQRSILGGRKTVHAPIKLEYLYESLDLSSGDLPIANWQDGGEGSIESERIKDETQRKLIQRLNRLDDLGKWDEPNTREYIGVLLDLYNREAIRITE